MTLCVLTLNMHHGQEVDNKLDDHSTAGWADSILPPSSLSSALQH